MDVNNEAINIHDHGTALDDHKKRVKCNHCGKVVSGFHRLKCHLGGIRGDVVPCEVVPVNVKEAMSSKLLEKKKGYLSKEVGELCRPELPWKRNSQSNNGVNDDDKVQNATGGSKKRVKEVLTAKVVSPSKYRKLKFSRATATTSATTEEDSSTSSLQVQKCIGRFFYETGIDLSAIECPSFQKMMNAIIHRSREYDDEEEVDCSRLLVPSYQQLRGMLLKDEVKEMQHLVKQVKDSWRNTGCSILLDGWIDGSGRNLINVLADCPLGPVYLRSLDITAALSNIDSLQMLLDQVIEEEIGAENVVQIITYSSSICMEALGKQLMNKYKNLFWAVSASQCLDLMLEKMGSLDLIKKSLEKAKVITKFVYSRAPLLKLMRNYTQSSDLVKSSRISSAMPFLTLENILTEKDNLKEMFDSSEWSSSSWASTMGGKRVADLVADNSFWSGVTMAVKATIPIVRVMLLIHDNDKPQLGFIYETLDQAKETIKDELKNKKAHYMPFWEIIDDIWNNKLHSPLHSAGYFLNPSLFYSSDFYADAEVATGLICCIVRMVEGKYLQDLVSSQVDDYREAKGSFGEGRTPNRRSNISPDIWWSKYGGQFPELQRLAIRVLSQTCDGASKYQLKRSLAEKLLTSGRNPIEQQRLNDLTFVHYNLQLKNFELGLSTIEEIDPMSDWIVDDHDGAHDVAPVQSFEPSWMELLMDFGDQSRTTTSSGAPEKKKLNVMGGSSSVTPKEEPG